MIDPRSVNSIFDATVFDCDGTKVGTVKQVYLDSETSDPLFVAVSTGLFGMSQSFVPLRDADFDGHDLRVRYDKDTIKDAPRIDPDRELSHEEEDRIWAHYAGGAADDTDESRIDTAHDRHDDSTDRANDVGDRREEPTDAEPEPPRRARLRRHIVTEQTVTVPTTAETGPAGSAPVSEQDVHDVHVHDERPVADENVPDDPDQPR